MKRPEGGWEVRRGSGRGRDGLSEVGRADAVGIVRCDGVLVRVGESEWDRHEQR